MCESEFEGTFFETKESCFDRQETLLQHFLYKWVPATVTAGPNKMLGVPGSDKMDLQIGVQLNDKKYEWTTKSTTGR